MEEMIQTEADALTDMYESMDENSGQCECQAEIYGKDDYWTGQDGTRYQIKQMTRTHIHNCIKMLERKLIRRSNTDAEPLNSCCVDYIESRINDLRNELTRRGLKQPSEYWIHCM